MKGHGTRTQKQTRIHFLDVWTSTLKETCADVFGSLVTTQMHMTFRWWLLQTPRVASMLVIPLYRRNAGTRPALLHHILQPGDARSAAYSRAIRASRRHTRASTGLRCLSASVSPLKDRSHRCAAMSVKAPSLLKCCETAVESWSSRCASESGPACLGSELSVKSWSRAAVCIGRLRNELMQRDRGKTQAANKSHAGCALQDSSHLWAKPVTEELHASGRCKLGCTLTGLVATVPCGFCESFGGDCQCESGADRWGRADRGPGQQSNSLCTSAHTTNESTHALYTGTLFESCCTQSRLTRNIAKLRTTTWKCFRLVWLWHRRGLHDAQICCQVIERTLFKETLCKTGIYPFLQVVPIGTSDARLARRQRCGLSPPSWALAQVGWDEQVPEWPLQEWRSIRRAFVVRLGALESDEHVRREVRVVQP